MIKQALPQQGQTITVDKVNYIVINSFRMSDKGPKFQGKPWSDNIVITAKRPKGKRFYSITLYRNGVYSSAVRHTS